LNKKKDLFSSFSDYFPGIPPTISF